VIKKKSTQKEIYAERMFRNMSTITITMEFFLTCATTQTNN